MPSHQKRQVTTNSKIHFQTLEALQRRLAHLRGIPLKWVEIAEMSEFGGVSPGLLSSILKGYEPKTNLTRAKLNLAPITAPAPFCAEHNTVHCFDCQTQQVTPKPNGRKGKGKPRYRAIAEMESAEQKQALYNRASDLQMTYSQMMQALADGRLGLRWNR